VEACEKTQLLGEIIGLRGNVAECADNVPSAAGGCAHPESWVARPCGGDGNTSPARIAAARLSAAMGVNRRRMFTYAVDAERWWQRRLWGAGRSARDDHRSEGSRGGESVP